MEIFDVIEWLKSEGYISDEESEEVTSALKEEDCSKCVHFTKLMEDYGTCDLQDCAFLSKDK